MLKNIFALSIHPEEFDINIIISFEILTNNDSIVLNSIEIIDKSKSIKDHYKNSNFLKVSNQLSSKNLNKLTKLKNLFYDYFKGKKIDLFQEIKDLGIKIPYEEIFQTTFSINVIKWILKNLKYGDYTSYSQIGQNLDSKAYQAIGNILRKNPFPLIIPCHRVIKKNGKIGGFMGKIQNSWQKDLKKSLLKMEKITNQNNKN
ncbi:MAG: methylated-DNA--[protein]-cysteine S-methyltransferase [Promethearchaeota archaeon]|nr:MAG: methylated-DNA--[protein]-cysteine S-methyltransferase [Candidatus Lokiarchaeota archaeon]